MITFPAIYRFGYFGDTDSWVDHRGLRLGPEGPLEAVC